MLGKEGICNGGDLRHVLLVQIETLKKQTVASTMSSTNVNPVEVLQCDLFGEGHKMVTIHHRVTL